MIERALDDLGLDWSRSPSGTYGVSLSGTHKLRIDCVLQLGSRSLSARVFVARHPESNHEQVYRWLLERNLRLALSKFSLDHLGDVYLIAQIPLNVVSGELVDQLLGELALTADESFNPIVARGFADSITAEREWRERRGLPTANLTAFGVATRQDSATDAVSRPPRT